MNFSSRKKMIQKKHSACFSGRKAKLITQEQKSSFLNMRKSKNLGWLLSLLLSWSAIANLGNLAKAQSATDAPSELQELIAQIESAANQQDLKTLLQFYSPQFTNNDGMNSASMAEALNQMWQNYPRLKYTTEIQSWERAGNELIAETVTHIQGTQQSQGRAINLDSTLHSRQYFQNQRLVRQEILSEKTKLTSGNNPPEVEVILPTEVKVGEQYNFDVVVTEPLGDNVLLGAATEEQTGSELFVNPNPLELEPLTSGGIYKLATAPKTPDDRWLSAILVRGDGITMITQRVRIEE
jgi:ketosteroid isomerase-like protein